MIEDEKNRIYNVTIKQQIHYLVKERLSILEFVAESTSRNDDLINLAEDVRHFESLIRYRG